MNKNFKKQTESHTDFKYQNHQTNPKMLTMFKDTGHT